MDLWVDVDLYPQIQLPIDLATFVAPLKKPLLIATLVVHSRDF